mmetsp:Transcript_43453/g.86251  ORF Transcript_43453/g.86251 Transcript_43453/m.86251 type:complete len:124 (-) Transcript_43453:32-403(-)
MQPAVLPSNEEPVCELADEEQLAEVLQQSGAKWVVVEFSAEWSAACQAMRAPLDRVALERPEAAFCRVDINKLPKTASREGATRVPAYAFFWNGNREAEFSGASDRKLREVMATCIELGPLSR